MAALSLYTQHKFDRGVTYSYTYSRLKTVLFAHASWLLNLRLCILLGALVVFLALTSP